jgi:trimethylamine--corrinoid protein Co-methyltransferase
MRLPDYGLQGGLSPEQIRTMHEKAMWLIETSGIQVPHQGVLKLLAGHDGVKIEKDIVRFRPDLVLRALKAAKYDVPEYARSGWVMSAGAHQTNCYGLDSGSLRLPTTQDLVDFLKLGDALDTVGSAPVIPMDVPVHLQHLLMHKLAYEHTRYRCNDIYEHMDKPSYECAMYVREMAQAAKKRFAFGIWMISPKSFDERNLEVAYRLRDLGIPMWVATMPQAGVTAPSPSWARCCRCSVLPGSCSPDEPRGASPRPTPDQHLRRVHALCGSVEYISTASQIALCKHYGIPIIVKSLLTTAKEPDAHAAAEMGIHTFIAALAGARAFRCGGLLSTGEVYCGEWVVILHEMIEYIKQVLKSEDFSEERLMVRDIVEVGPGGTYVDKRSTYELFRKEYWTPGLFEHSNVGQWIELGSKSMRQQAQEAARRLIAGHSYAIDGKVKKELDKIYERARRDQALEKSLKLQI